ncbi:unnamed protein product [Rhizoctonia solani]|uniref:DUF7598 domain-containing protein n=1 Tax=Rhizoctonia solani TaxID=456999 RepID=A0A8H3GC56_9AGAM|nr:unnamed protein product [Rhizoctonia solani]
MFGIRPLCFGLNIVRALSIIALTLVVISSIIVMVRDANAICREMSILDEPDTDKTRNKSSSEHAYITSSTVPLQPGGPFFAVLSRLLVVCQCLILIFAELEWPKKSFTDFLPILGSEFGVGILGMMQVLLGISILSHHIPEFALVSAFILFAIGCLNIILGLAFRKSIHSHRALDTGSMRESEGAGETQSSNRRTSFRPGSKQSMTLSSIDGSTHTYTEKQPPYEKLTGSKTTGDGSIDMPKHGEPMDLGFSRQAQQRAEKDGYSVPPPEQSHPKHGPTVPQLQSN